MSTTKKSSSAQNVKVGGAVVYPVRGVGRITTVEQQEVAGFKLEVFVVAFDREKATLKIPTARAANQGLRRIADAAALEVLSGRARKSREMWSRRAHELEAKINPSDLVQWVEVARDLHRDKGQSDASFSERGLYESATALIAHEISASRDISEAEAMALILTSLATSQRQAAKADIGSDDGPDLEEKVA